MPSRRAYEDASGKRVPGESADDYTTPGAAPPLGQASDVDVTEARQRRPTRLALYANRCMDPEIALNQLRNRRTVVEQRQGAAAHVGERLLRVDA